MFNSIKEKTLGVRKWKVLLAFGLVISMFTMVACESKEVQVTTEELELVSCYIEYRNKTNWLGGILKTEEYLHYGYTNADGEVTFDEMHFGNHINFQITEETPKVIIETSPGKKSYTFQLTREMYENLNSSQK